ncbi:MAG TPA: glycosyltransferase family 4 protein [Stellaceae bacterium]|nr:glycosyltransferase family 4 protein [Stellaceae bacterium]
MKFVFVHQTFPGQYLHLIQHLQAAGHSIVFVTQRRDREIEGIRMLEYLPAPMSAGAQQSYVHDLEGGVMNGLAVARLCEGLKREGFTPDIVIGHTGWGELIFIKDVWPDVPLLGYFEFFYRPRGSDLDFDPEFPATIEDAMRVRVRNATNMLSLQAADWGHTPIKWQRDQYPEEYHDRIAVIHEGIDTARAHPDETARLWLSGGLSFSRQDQVLTYCARRLEPYRGFHTFMRALPKVLTECPKAHVVIVGGDGVSYGRPPTSGLSWREHMLAELGDRLDRSRVHFVGWLPYAQYLAVLQISSAHIYLTYPFVLSWGMLEAMAAECVVIGSRTAPVEEVIDGTTNGYLVDFFDTDAMADKISWVLQNQEASKAIRKNARRYVLDQFDLNTVCLPAHLALIKKITGVDPVPSARPRRRAGARAALATAR